MALFDVTHKIKTLAFIQPWRSFLFWGAMSNLFSYTIYLLLKLIISYQQAYCLAYVAGIIFSYVCNTKMVFKVRQSVKTAILYPVIYIIQYTIAALLLHSLVKSALVSDTVAPLLVVVAVVPFTFIMTKLAISK